MSRFEALLFDGEPCFQCSGTMEQVEEATEREVAAIWRKASADRSTLTDDRVLAVRRYDAERIESVAVPYRFVLAQTVRPELFQKLELQPLATTGLLSCEGRLVFGCRAPWVTEEPGMFEFAPAGSVDAEFVDEGGRVGLDEQFDRELHEELGIDASALKGRRKLGVIRDCNSHVIDVVVRAELKCSWTELVDAHRRLRVQEYTGLAGYRPEEVEEMLANGGHRMTPISAAIFTGLFDAV